MNRDALLKIRQLCSLGLSTHSVVPQLMRLIHNCILSDANAYFWVDENGNLIELYDERPESYLLMGLYSDEFFHSKESEVFAGWPTTLHYRQSVNMDCLWKVGRRDFLKSTFYNELYRKAGMYWGLHRPIAYGGRVQAGIQLHRDKRHDNFSANDHLVLDSIARHIEYAYDTLKIEAEGHTQMACAEGFIIVNTDTEVLNYSENAVRLVAQILDKGSNRKPTQISSAKLAPIFRDLVSRLKKMSFTLDGGVPVTDFTNKWGRFRLSAFFMKSVISADQESSALINIKIEQFAYSQILLFENLDSYDLTARQRDVALHIGLGEPYKDIAATLEVKLSTIISHKKEIFEKIGVENRQSFINKLLAHNA